MEREVHQNLEALNQTLEGLDLSPAETLILFNHMIGRLAAITLPMDWREITASAADAVHRGRARAH
jgi:hypothetical protein